jgi:hypothetical protein
VVPPPAAVKGPTGPQPGFTGPPPGWNKPGTGIPAPQGQKKCVIVNGQPVCK